MKTIERIILLLSVVFALSFISCQKDSEPSETQFSGFMTGYTDSQGYFYLLKNDFGVKYSVEDKSQKYLPDTLYRMAATIALDSDSSAHILQIVPTISYRALSNSQIPVTLRKKDPLEIQSVYIGGGFLNIIAGTKVQKEDNNSGIPFYARMDNSSKLKFTIYYDSGNEEPIYTKLIYISIPLSDYGLAKNDTVYLSCKGYDKDYSYKLVYK